MTRRLHHASGRRWQFSLRAMVVLITATAVLLGLCKTLLLLWPEATRGWITNLANMVIALFLCFVLPLGLLLFFAICLASPLSDMLGQAAVSESPAPLDSDRSPQSLPGESIHDQPT